MAAPESPVTRWRNEVKAIVDASLGFAVEMPIGRKNRNENSDCPRVAWLLLDAADAPASGPGGNARTLGTVVQRLALECWGEDFDATWQLLFQVRRAIYIAMNGNHSFRGHRWLTEEEERAGHYNRGDVARLEVQIACPIPDAKASAVTVTSAGHTTAFEGADPGCSS